jgi:hypothetical protein
MRPVLDLTQRETITQLQGDHVLVHRPGFPDRVFQFRTLVDEGRHELHLVFRPPGKNVKRVDWKATQKIIDALKPLTPDAADPYSPKWQLNLQ